MKKLVIVLGLLLFCGQGVFATQDSNVEDNKAVVSIQKGGEADKAEQKQGVKNNWFCIVIQINGKVLDSTNK